MENSLQDTKTNLDAISPTFCLIKWKHATINLAVDTVKTCCHNQPHKVVAGTPIEFFNNHPSDEGIRQQMLAGEKPKDCHYCWEMEKNGRYSDRIHWSNMSWMRASLEEVAKHKSAKALAPSWLEINFSSTCNLKCSYCNPGYSTSWQKEVEESGPYPTSKPHNDIQWFRKEGLVKNNGEEMTLRELFWPWFQKNSQDIRLLTLTGGEPLLAKETFRVLEYLQRNSHPEMQLAINSNICLPEKTWQSFVGVIKDLSQTKAVKRIYLHPSLDSWGSRAEYIRFGLNLELFRKNMDYFLENTDANVVFNCTLNNLSLGGLLDYWKYIVDLKRKHGKGRWISSTMELLVFPAWQRLDLLPLEFESYLLELQNFLESSQDVVSKHEIEGVIRARDFLKQRETRSERSVREDFYRFFKEHDRRRKTNFLETFPELRDFFLAGL